MSKYAHTHLQRYLRKHDRGVGPKKNDNKSNKAAKTTSKTRKGKNGKGEKEQKANRPITGQQGNRPTVSALSYFVCLKVFLKLVTKRAHVERVLGWK